MAKKFETLRDRMSPISRARADAMTQLMLDALARDIESHHEKLRTIDAQLVDRIRSLVGGVDVDLDAPLKREHDE